MATTNQGADALAAPTLAVDEIEGSLGRMVLQASMEDNE
jgi:hypothetical protein